jgi:dihydroneopterin aldolase
MISSDKIRLKSMLFYAYHGALEEERTIGQMFEVDLDVSGNFSRDQGLDDLHWTVDYTLLYRAVAEIFTKKSFQLLETGAGVIADGILSKFDPVHEVTVRVRKPHVPMGGLIKYVEVEVTRRRQLT